jgi:hypothetical protein
VKAKEVVLILKLLPTLIEVDTLKSMPEVVVYEKLEDK